MNAADHIFLHELVHLLIVLAVVGWIWRRERDWRLAVAALLTGFFIDVDHWFDYLMFFGLHLNLVNFFHVRSYVLGSGKVYVLFHGWEFVPLVYWLANRLGRRWRLRYLGLAAALAYLGHLGWDQFSFAHSPWSYFFTYRLAHGFSLRAFNGF